MMDNGKIIKCMVGVNSTIKVVNWLMRDIGLMMNHMVMGKKIGEMAIFIRGILRVDSKRAKENIYGLMDPVTTGAG